MVRIKQEGLHSEFLLGYSISCKGHVETFGLCEHLLRIPLSCSFPSYLRLLPHRLGIPLIFGNTANFKLQCVCRFCADTDWQDSNCISAPTKIWWEAGGRQVLPVTSLQTRLSWTLKLAILKFGENTWNQSFFTFMAAITFFFSLSLLAAGPTSS